MGEKSDERKDVESTGKKIPYPKAVFGILANEFCERFSYYGMRAVLTLYLKNILKFSEDDSTVIYHAFTMLCYFTPLLGAMIADSLLGKFRTIFYLSVIYAVGNVVLSMGAAPDFLPQVPFSLVGLVLIGVGTGGIKPCVSAFGGDQFQVPEQAKELATFFSIFYFSINAGSLISTLITPVFRKDVSCLGQDTCYTLAFSVPAALMITALVIFLIGRPFYTIKSPEGNVIAQVAKTIGHALSRKRKSKDKKEHWMDYADDKYSKKNIEEIKILLRVLFLYIPLPFFWALFDQQGSRWTFQATRMDGDIGFFFVKPDQMQVTNPLLILLFIPLFEKIVYPVLAKFGLLKKPLQRLATGGVFAGIAFVVSGLIELQLKTTYPTELAAGNAQLHLINMAPYNFDVKLLPIGNDDGTTLDFSIDSMTNKIASSSVKEGTYKLEFMNDETNAITCANDDAKQFMLHGEQATSILLAWDNDLLHCVIPQARPNTKPEESVYDTLDKEDEGNPFVRVIQYGLWEDPMRSGNGYDEKIAAKNRWFRVGLEDVKKRIYYETFEYIDDVNGTIYSDWRSTPTQAIEFHEYDIFIGTGDRHNDSDIVDLNVTQLAGRVDIKLGGSYILTVVQNGTGLEPEYSYLLNEIVSPNSMHMFWLLPQYIIMTAGEVMFSVTIMDFSYSQAPVSMKSVMQAAWLLTVAFGNLIDVIVAAAKIFDEQWKEFFFFAGLMFADMILFSYLAYKYTPADPNVLLAALDEDKDEDDKEGKDNPAYE